MRTVDLLLCLIVLVGIVGIGSIIIAMIVAWLWWDLRALMTLIYGAVIAAATFYVEMWLTLLYVLFSIRDEMKNIRTGHHNSYI